MNCRLGIYSEVQWKDQFWPMRNDLKFPVDSLTLSIAGVHGVAGRPSVQPVDLGMSS